MSNSELVDYIKLSPNKNAGKTKTDIVIHHMAGNLTVEQCGEVFQTRLASANYGIGSDGRIGMYVEESNRSWATSNRELDERAVTIEVANDVIGGDWHVSDKALASLINLCVDVCKRNGIKMINYTDDKSGNLHMHRWYAATACPGPYLASKFEYISEEVNKQMSGIRYRVHQQTYGWSDWVNEGEVAGITGQSKRLEAIQIDPLGKEIYVQAHIQGLGWVDFGKIDKEMVIGTVGQGKRLEAIELTGAKALCHIQSIGWAKDFATSQGTVGLGKRIEAIKIKTV